jgi:hypothetical protein
VSELLAVAEDSREVVLRVRREATAGAALMEESVVVLRAVRSHTPEAPGQGGLESLYLQVLMVENQAGARHTANTETSDSKNGDSTPQSALYTSSAPASSSSASEAEGDAGDPGHGAPLGGRGGLRAARASTARSQRPDLLRELSEVLVGAIGAAVSR